MRRGRLTTLLAALMALGAVSAFGGDGIQEFLGRHWRQPLAPQGPPPAPFSPLEASLQPEACGTCHPALLPEWQTSLHARWMGPGVAGQLVEMLETDAEAGLGCLRCHAPLAEQAPVAGDGARANPTYDEALGARGLVCAGCHVRGHQRFGPPRRAGSPASAAPGETLAHDGAALEASRRAPFTVFERELPLS